MTRPKLTSEEIKEKQRLLQYYLDLFRSEIITIMLLPHSQELQHHIDRLTSRHDAFLKAMFPEFYI
jgi:hypothetical protein